MTGFDFEAADAWHPDDPPAELVRNLGRRIAEIDRLAEPRGTSLRARVAAIAHRLERAERRHRLPDADRVRLELLAIDLDYVRGLI